MQEKNPTSSLRPILSPHFHTLVRTLVVEGYVSETSSYNMSIPRLFGGFFELDRPDSIVP
jgi:hypothetical protein